MTRKTLRNIIWTAAAVLAIASLVNGAYHHLATAGIIFILGSFQTDPSTKDKRYEL
jgi:hypothetical protein